MALIIVRRQDIVKPVISVKKQSGFNWDEWYAQNKGRLSEKRAKRYRDDPDYRQAALKRSENQRLGKKTPVTDGHTIAFADAANQLGITVWVLREWRKKDYFPEPFRRDGRLWFSHGQVDLLQRIQQFFLDHGVRVNEAKRNQLQNVVSLTYANW